MSHYSVLVIGPNVEEQLAPYHEFECTGRDDQYVQTIDRTEEARKDYDEHTETRYKDADGNLLSCFTDEGEYQEEFLREFTPEEKEKNGQMIGSGYSNGLHFTSHDWKDGLGYRTRVFQVPEGLTKVEAPTKDFKSFAEFIEGYYGHKIVPFGQQPNLLPTTDENGYDIASNHKYGYTLVDEKGDVIATYDRTNPNKKWDGYVIGGRWNGFFKLKEAAVGLIGEVGSLALANDYEEPGADRADILMKGDIDIQGMRDEAAREATERHILFENTVSGMPKAITWEEAQAKHTTEVDGKPTVNWEAARDEFNEQPAINALRANHDTIWFHYEDYNVPREQYVQSFRDNALSTFAVVKDGKWFERGTMGWWGAVSNEKDKSAWNRQMTELIDGLPDDTLLTVVDCHI